MEEEWADITGFSNYMVSNHGRVCNWRSGVVLRPRPSGWGYLQVMLYRGRLYTKSVHRLVGEAFIPGYDEGLEVNHIDGDKTNNFESNLEWVTKGMNNQHAVSTGLRRARATPVEVVETGEIFPTVKACAEHFGTWPTAISAVLTGRRPHYKGFRLRYVR